MNSYDSDRILESLSLTHEKVEKPENADLIILNTCHIRERAAEKIYSEIGKLSKLKRENKNLKLVVAGCVAQAEGSAMISRQPNIDAVIGPQMYHDFSNLLNEKKKSERIKLNFENIKKFQNYKNKRMLSSVSSFVTVQEGCDKFCSFCVVPFTRGAENSRNLEEIIKEVEDLSLLGCKEIILLGQNVNAYHGLHSKNNEADLSQLIYEIEKINGIERISYTTSHPVDMKESLMLLHGSSRKLNPYLHLPVQSGSNRILKMMNRKYSTKEYVDIIEKIRKSRPDIALSSDFIVGYPGETKEDFRKTIDLVKFIEFSQSYSFKYSARPGTKASRSDSVLCTKESSDRLYELQDLLKSQQKKFNKQFLGKQVKVLCKGKGKKEGQLRGTTQWMQVVNFKGKKVKSPIVNVKISRVTDNSLLGEAV
ncbi:MAG: tRNA (N6-isopentenyl adenosine(37)-C2)-methylthiotransferase MiaB [Rickettsiales bacterium]|nr:tRNA (N6-isopentenyl adenosine(37)-C2)-methylthiotransferase MiaB [Rickettsiales bacterium]